MGRAVATYDDKTGNNYYSESNDIIFKIEGLPKVFSRIFLDQQTLKGSSTGDLTVIITNPEIEPVKHNIPISMDSDLIRLRKHSLLVVFP